MELQVNLKEWLKKLVYMKTEVDTKLSSKANTNHTHDIASLPDETDMLGHMENDFYTALDTKANKTTATTSANGLMSKEDKSKLDDIATEANKTIVDSSLSSSSTNPVQNKVVNSALNGKANSSHSHSISNITNLQSALDSKSATGHNHDERYYTETEINTKLNGKANSSHSHSISNITNLQSALDSKSATGHNHDERYYTETEINTKLNGKANSSHTHTASQISDLTVSTHTLANGAIIYKYRKIVLAVFNNYQYSGKTPNVWTDLFNIPSAYRPISTDNIYGHCEGPSMILAGSNKISLYPGSASGGVFGFIVWLTS